MCILAALASLLGGAGCAQVSQHNRDKLVRSRTETKLLSDWRFAGQGALMKDDAGDLRVVAATVHRDKACLLTEVRTVDRTVVTEREMLSARRSRLMAYTMGTVGAAGAVTNIYFATQAKDEAAEVGLGVLAGFGTYLSIGLLVHIVRELNSIDTEEHVGEVEVRAARRARCDTERAPGAHVRLLRAKGAAASEGWTNDDGVVKLAADPATEDDDAVYALEVNGVIVSYVEIPGRKRVPAVAAPPDPPPPPQPEPPTQQQPPQ